MSGSVGTVVTPEAALEILEPALVRWPYVQRTPNQSFGIDVSAKGIQRQYDHWDQFVATATAAEARADQAANYRMSVQTEAGHVDRTERPVSFRLLASLADITQRQPRADGADRRQPPRRAAAGDRAAAGRARAAAELRAALRDRDRAARAADDDPRDLQRRGVAGARRAHPGGRGDAGARHPRALVARRADHARLRRAEAAARAPAATPPRRPSSSRPSGSSSRRSTSSCAAPRPGRGCRR